MPTSASPCSARPGGRPGSGSSAPIPLASCSRLRWPDTARGGAAAVLVAAVLFGTTGTAQALADPTGSPYAVGAARLLLGGAGLVAVALIAGHRTRSLVALVRTPPGLVAATAVAGYPLGFFAGVARDGVAVAPL